MQPQPPLVLGSSSPYRRDALARLGLAFTVCSPAIDEAAKAGERPAGTALRLAREKAGAVATRHPHALIIGSDQIAHCDDVVFGKPLTHENAVRQLRAMSAREVNFETAVCLLNAATGAVQVANVPTSIRFRSLDDALIESYLARDKPYQCAGSAKIESLGIALIESMRSDDPTAIVGLPLIALCGMLAREGLRVV